MHEAPNDDLVAAGALLYDGAREREIVAAYEAFVAGAEPALEAKLTVVAPPASAPVGGRRIVRVDFRYAGSLERAVVAHADLRAALGTPALDTVEPRPRA